MIPFQKPGALGIKIAALGPPTEHPYWDPLRHLTLGIGVWMKDVSLETYSSGVFDDVN